MTASRRTSRGVVAAGDPQTARAGAQALRAGGNAVDAVCAAAFASFVCELPLTSPAGAGLLLHGSPERGWRVLDFFARVPGLEGRPEALDFFAVEIDFGSATQGFHVGRGAAAVPGALRGLLDVHQAHGRLPLADVVAPALELARSGYVLSPALAYVARLLEPIYRVTPGAWSMLTIDGALAEGGARLIPPGQAHLLEMLTRDPDATLAALTSDLIRDFGPAEGGLLGAEDFRRSRGVERAPLSIPFAGRTVLTPPAPSAGGGLVGLGLRLAEQSGLLDRPFGAHRIHLARVLAAVSRARAEDYAGGGSPPDGIETRLEEGEVSAVWERTQRFLTERALGGTTHISVLDGAGGAASMTNSNGEGCGHVLSGWGVHVNNFLGEEDINPEGFHRQPAGTEMTTMMAPTVVLDQGRPTLVLGSGGSNRLRSALLLTLLNHLGWGRSLSESIDADRLHVEGSRLWFESSAMDEGEAQALERAWPGASRFEAQNMFFGGVHAVASAEGDHELGAADARRDGAVCTPDEV